MVVGYHHFRRHPYNISNSKGFMYLTWIGRLSTPIRKESSTDARLIIAAAVCDGLDGHVARLGVLWDGSYCLGFSWPFGKCLMLRLKKTSPRIKLQSWNRRMFFFWRYNLQVTNEILSFCLEIVGNSIHLFWLKTHENSKAINSSTKMGPMSVGKSWNIVKITSLVTWCCLVFFWWFMEENNTHWTFIITSDGIQVLPDSDWIWSSTT